MEFEWSAVSDTSNRATKSMKTHLQFTCAASLAIAVVLSACSTKQPPTKSTASVTSAAMTVTNTAIIPVPRDTNWVKRHEGFVARAKQGNVDILFMGDSITDGWRGQKLWKEKYEPMKA